MFVNYDLISIIVKWNLSLFSIERDHKLWRIRPLSWCESCTRWLFESGASYKMLQHDSQMNKSLCNIKYTLQDVILTHFHTTSSLYSCQLFNYFHLSSKNHPQQLHVRTVHFTYALLLARTYELERASVGIKACPTIDCPEGTLIDCRAQVLYEIALNFIDMECNILKELWSNDITTRQSDEKCWLDNAQWIQSFVHCCAL